MPVSRPTTCALLAVVVTVVVVVVMVGCAKLAVKTKGSTAVKVLRDAEESEAARLDAGSANPELYEDIYTEPFVFGRIDTAYDFRQPRTDLPIGRAIRKMHGDLGHDVSEFEIITGLGSTHVLNCVFAALDSSSQPTPPYTPSYSFWQQSPSYSLHENICKQLKIPWGIGKGRVGTIEVVTSPNNPTGELMRPRNVSTVPALIHDAVQEWPVYGKELRPGQQYEELTRGGDVAVLAIYSFTKSNGLASSRVGYALVSEHWLRVFPGFIDDYEKVMRTFVLCGCMQGERIAATLAVKDLRREFAQVRGILEARFDQMKDILEPAGFAILSKRGFPYVWLFKRGKVSDFPNSSDYFSNYMDLEIRDGKTFGASNEHVRLNIYQKQSNWVKVVARIKTRLEYKPPPPPAPATPRQIPPKRAHYSIPAN